jgi:hypothetical protein
VPNHIQRPEYYATGGTHFYSLNCYKKFLGQPTTEMKQRGNNKIHINTPEQIAGIREGWRVYLLK